MSVDLLGPANATNAVTVRPADTRVFGTADSFFKDCSSPTSQDGTKITSAYLNGLLQQVRRAIRGMSVTEDNTNDDMLLNAIQSARDFYLIDTAVTKTVHGVGSDFADLNAAMEWASKYRITKNGSLTFTIASGQQAYTTNVTIAHPSGDRISIVGANMLAAAPTAASFTVTGNSSGARATDATTNLTMLRTKYATELKFTGAVGITVIGNIGLLDKLLITGDGTAGGNGLLVNGGPLFKMGAVSTHGFGNNGFYMSAGIASVATCLTGSGCVSTGIVFANYANCAPAGGTICAFGNGGNGLATNAGFELDPNLAAGVIACSGNAVHGAFAVGGYFIGATGSQFNNNGSSGICVSFGRANVQNSTFSNNASWGVLAQNGADVIVTGLSATGNGSGNIFALAKTEVQAAGFAGGSLSPAANTLGNNNSLIVV